MDLQMVLDYLRKAKTDGVSEQMAIRYLLSQSNNLNHAVFKYYIESYKNTILKENLLSNEGLNKIINYYNNYSSLFYFIDNGQKVKIRPVWWGLSKVKNIKEIGLLTEEELEELNYFLKKTYPAEKRLNMDVLLIVNYNSVDAAVMFLKKNPEKLKGLTQGYESTFNIDYNKNFTDILFLTEDEEKRLNAILNSFYSISITERFNLVPKQSNQLKIYTLLLQLNSEKEITDYITANPDVLNVLKDSLINGEYKKNIVDEYILSLSERRLLIGVFEPFANQRKKEYLEQVEKSLSEERARRKFYQVYENRKNLVLEFVNSELNKKEFCLAHNMSTAMLDGMVEDVKEKNPEIYELYSKKTRQTMVQSYSTLISYARKMVEYIQNGYPIDKNSVRPFDIIDFHSMTTIPFDDFLKIVKPSLKVDEIKIIMKFKSKVGVEKPLNYKALYSTYVKYDVKYDEKGKEIPGTGRLIEKEEKKAIIDWLYSNKIPVNIATYQAAFLRWKNGYIDDLPTQFYSSSKTIK